MSIPYEERGRREQKARTKQALVEAAQAFVAEGVTPTVEQAASRAAISRTTAYRYFPNQRSLLIAAHPHIDAPSLLPDPAPADAESRLDAVVEAHGRQILRLEPQLRTMLRLSLEPGAGSRQHEQLLLRKGRAIGWIEEALAPLRGTMTEAQLHRLAIAIRSVEGIEALVWLTDVAGLSRLDALRIMRWSAQALLRSAIVDGPPPAPRGRRSVGQR